MGIILLAVMSNLLVVIFTVVPLPVVDFGARVQQHAVGSLEEAFAQPLDFMIPTGNAALVRDYPATFELGMGSFGLSMDSWLEHKVVGDSEVAVTTLDGSWLGLLQDVFHAAILRDEKDVSSRAYLRPDATALFRNAVGLKIEAKAKAVDLRSDDLTRKLFPDAYLVFPIGSLSIVGALTSITQCELIKISYNENTRAFETAPLGQYTVSILPDRVRFITDIVKLCRWFVTITGTRFHLTPNVRTRTPNGHFVTWNSNGLVKEYKTAGLRPHLLANIATVYDLRLANVEWGHVDEANNTVVITRLGHTLQTALAENYVTRQDVVDGVRAALDQLHGAGWAHCDVHLGNVFVSTDTHTVFLDDLEYLVRHDGEIIPHNLRLPSDAPVPSTPVELDERQFEAFSGVIMNT